VLLEEIRDEIAVRMDRGASTVAVEAELIEPAHELSDDERAALWLFAWSYPRVRGLDRDRELRSGA
jgi:hypothetical protein